eukprot:TRINITY_DN19722_c0_g1_i2.p1 TRINITY_DN19722_c0_g1~~TRINITY_DN19722_c0_g1_i2.p1  ORF type:complete len:110 (+),score=0.51 TRINITY_DN19722_c0_g1_i2:151-480(+)
MGQGFGDEAPKQKGPEPFGVRASGERAWEGMRLSATSTRWQSTLECINARFRVVQRMHGVRATQVRGGRRQVESLAETRAHERPARDGSNAGELACGVHDGTLVEAVAL